MKKILILEGSPRVHVNSNILSEQFAQGANEAGHETEIREKMIAADIIVLSSPIYY